MDIDSKDFMIPTTKSKKREFWLSEEGLGYVHDVVMTRGLNDTELIKWMNVSNNFFYTLKKVKEFEENLNHARQISIKQIERSAFEIATQKQRIYKEVVVRGEVYEVYEEIPISEKTLQFLLKTRKKEVYGDKVEIENNVNHSIETENIVRIQNMFSTNRSEQDIEEEKSRLDEMQRIDEENAQLHI